MRERLPYPRVRDSRGLTTELREFLRRQYGRPECPGFWDGCVCRECLADRLILAPWLQEETSLLAGRIDWRAPVLFVGEAPNARACECGKAFCPHSSTGRRLEQLLGCPVHDVGAAVNVFASSGPWDSARARRRGDEVRAALAYRTALGLSHPERLVLLGRRVAVAFGLLRAGWFEWRDVSGASGAAAPHPSGLSRWWNGAGRRAQAEAFFRSLR